jgi:hypothetical protein
MRSIWLCFGINWDAKFPAKRPFSWVDLDEQNRAWWAIVIIDRYETPASVRSAILEGRVRSSESFNYEPDEAITLIITQCFENRLSKTSILNRRPLFRSYLASWWQGMGWRGESQVQERVPNF